MSVKHSFAGRNPPRAPKRNRPANRRPAGRPSLLTVRSALILGAGCIAGVITGVLTYLSPASPARSVLAGLAAFAAATVALNSWIA